MACSLLAPASSLRGWPAGCPAKRGIRPVGRSVPLPLPPSVWAAAGRAAPAARAACGSPGGAGHGVAPGVRLGSSVRRRCEVWACSHPSGNRDCHVCQLAQAVGPAWHQEPVSLFDRSTVSPSRPGFRAAPRAAAVKTGPTKGRATAEGGVMVLTAASTAPDWARLERDHAACRSASFLCSVKCCMSK